jgi:hypothetical protein
MWRLARVGKNHMIGSVTVRYDRMYVHKKHLYVSFADISMYNHCLNVF